MTERDLMEIQKQMREAEKSTTPFAIVDGEGSISVIGDANKTELKKYSYTVKFRVPTQFASLIGGGNEIINGKYTVAEIEYPDVYISPRKDILLLNYLNDLKGFLVEVLPDGETKDRGDDELVPIIMSNITNKVILNAMYEFVGTAIGVSDELIPMMLYESVFENFIKLIEDFPELINEQDFFTGGPSLNKTQKIEM